MSAYSRQRCLFVAGAHAVANDQLFDYFDSDMLHEREDFAQGHHLRRMPQMNLDVRPAQPSRPKQQQWAVPADLHAKVTLDRAPSYDIGLLHVPPQASSSLPHSRLIGWPFHAAEDPHFDGALKRSMLKAAVATRLVEGPNDATWLSMSPQDAAKALSASRLDPSKLSDRAVRRALQLAPRVAAGDADAARELAGRSELAARTVVPLPPREAPRERDERRRIAALERGIDAWLAR